MKNKLRVMTVFGTRPEAIKMAPVIFELEKNKSFEDINVVTAQHRQMLDQVLETFKIYPDYDLNIMKNKQTLSDITTSVIEKLDGVIEKEKPDIVLVHGDTTTTFAASISAFYHKIPIGHVEAGLRTWDKYSPFPEEMNRQITDVVSDMYFAPTNLSKKNLLRENHEEKNIFVTGNTAIDALKQTVSSDYKHDSLNLVDPKNKMILVTMHRRENLGEPMRQVFRGIKEVIKKNKNVEVIYPVHLNPSIVEDANKILGDEDRIHLIRPLDVLDFHNFAARSYFIMTDSGGVQEEAPSLGKPVLVLRSMTERPEGVSAGTLKIVGTHKRDIVENMNDLLNNKDEYIKMSNAINPYGDGKSAKRIVDAIAYRFGMSNNKPKDFE